MDPFISEIRIMSFGFAPNGWAQCEGQLLPVAQNGQLFSLLGNMYGGDGVNNFALPDLRGRIPMQVGNGHVLAERGGEQEHTLNINETPAHTHQAYGTPTAGDSPIPAGNFLGGATSLYASLTNSTTLPPATVANLTGSQPHQNMQPYLALNFCIALTGVYPPQS